MTDEERIVQRYKDKIRNPQTAIRAHCVECMGGQPYYVKDCTCPKCALFPFKLGKNPFWKTSDTSGQNLKKMNAKQDKTAGAGG